MNTLFLLCTLAALVYAISTNGEGDLESTLWDQGLLDELKHQLYMSGLDLMRDYKAEREAAYQVESEALGNHYEISDESSDSHHRSRRSDIIINMVKAAQKTGNREELQIRSSEAFAKSDYFTGSSDVLALDIDNPSSHLRYFAISKSKGASGTYNSAVYIVRLNQTSGEFALHQMLPEIAPYRMALHHGYVSPLEKKSFFAVAGYSEDPSITTVVSIYQVVNKPTLMFLKTQLIPYRNIAAITFMEMKKTTYFIAGSMYQMANGNKLYSWPSQISILRFDPSSNYFHYDSGLPASGISDVTAFTTRTKTFIVATNYRDDNGNLDIFSYVYEFDELRRRFQQTLYLPTHGATDVEHFVLANEDYIVIANEASGHVDSKNYDVYSNVYKVDGGKFDLVQTLETYGATRWKSLAVPNCKQDVLLIYTDRRDNIDQVGIYSFSHDQESFKVAPFSLYHLDNVNTTFRPEPTSLSAYSTQDFLTGDYSLFIIIGANNTEEGSSIYKIYYDVILTDSPINAFKRQVAAELETINNTLSDVKRLLGEAENTIADAVTYTSDQTITGIKTIGTLDIQTVNITFLNVTEGSILYKDSTGQLHRANPNEIQDWPLHVLQNMTDMHKKDIQALKEKTSNILLTNTEQNVSATITFEEAILQTDLTTENLTVDTLNGVNVTKLLTSIVTKNESAVITSLKTFTENTEFRNISSDGNINNINFKSDLVINGWNQVITGEKLFTEDIQVSGDLHTQKVNNLSISDDVVLINKPANITGTKTFQYGLRTRNATINSTVNTYNFNDLFFNVFRKSVHQVVDGYKSFNDVLSQDNIIGNVLVNGYDLKQLEQQSKSTKDVIYGNKIFANVTISEEMNVTQTVNNFTFPEDVLFKNIPTTVHNHQIFQAPISVLNNMLLESINGVNTSDLVTLDSKQDLYGLLTFNSSVVISENVHMSENKTVNGIDLSEFVKDIVSLNSAEEVGTLNFQEAVELHSTETIKLNGEHSTYYQQLYSNSLHINGTQTISGNVTISSTKDVTNTEDVSADTVNGYRIPESFASVDGEQTFTGEITFTNITNFINIYINDSVNSINFQDFLDDLVFKDEDTTILSLKNFADDVYVEGEIISNSTINNIDFSEDLLLLHTNQTITGVKHFNIINATRLVTILDDLHVQTTIDDVDLSELDLSAMTVSKNETITGTKCFENTDYNRSVEYVNGIDLSALRDDIVTINTDQEILSEKTFDNVHFKANITTTSTVNGVDISELSEAVVYNDRPTTITGTITVHNITVLKNMKTGLVNNINISSLVHRLVSRSKSENISHLVVNGDVMVNLMETTTINNLDVLTEIVYRTWNQTIHGNKSFSNMAVTNIFSEIVNGLNLTDLRYSVVFKDEDQEIIGDKLFKQDVNMASNLTLDLINGHFDITNWTYIRTAGVESQNVLGLITFNSTIRFGQLNAENLNGQNLSDFLQRVVKIDEDITVDGPITFTSGLEADHLQYTGQNLEVTNFINNIDINMLHSSILKIVGDQNVKSLTYEGTISVDELTVNNTIDGHKIPDDFVTKHTEQTITGSIIFKNIHIYEELVVEDLINGVNITELSQTSLLKNKNGTQFMTGDVTFSSKVVAVEIEVQDTVQGIEFGPERFVTLNSDQNVTGNWTFAKDLEAVNIVVTDTINEVNLSHFNKTRVLKSSDSTIHGDIVFVNLLIGGDINITGFVNGVDLSEYQQQSPNLDEELFLLESDLNRTLWNQCAALTFMKETLTDSGCGLDYLAYHQQIEYSRVQHSEAFNIEGNMYIGLTVASRFSHCGQFVIMKLNTETEQFENYQNIVNSDGRQLKFFQAPWNNNSSYLIAINRKADCNIQGPSVIYKWDTTLQKFEPVITMDTMYGEQVEILTTLNEVYIFISSMNVSLKTYVFNGTSLTTHPFGIGVISKVVHAFKFLSQSYIVVGSKTTSTSSRGYADVYFFDGVTMTQFESLQTRGISSIVTFNANDKLYLVITNENDYSEDGHSTYDVDMEIYNLNEVTHTFQWFQSIPTTRATHATVMPYGTHILLIVTHYDWSVVIHRFAYELGFQKIDEVIADNCHSTLSFKHNESSFLVINSDDRGTSQTPTSVVLKMFPIGVNDKDASVIKDCSPTVD